MTQDRSGVSKYLGDVLHDVDSTYKAAREVADAALDHGDVLGRSVSQTVRTVIRKNDDGAAKGSLADQVAELRQRVVQLEERMNEAGSP